MNSTVLCPSCGTRNSVERDFCEECEAILRPAPGQASDTNVASGAPHSHAEITRPQQPASTFRCPDCQTAYPADRTYCPRCGLWLHENAAALPPAAAALRVPIPPQRETETPLRVAVPLMTGAASSVPLPMGATQRGSGLRALITSIVAGAALGLVGLFLITTFLGGPEEPPTTALTIEGPSLGAIVVATTEPTPVPVKATPAPVKPTPVVAIANEPTAETEPTTESTPTQEPIATSEPEPESRLTLERLDKDRVASLEDADPAGAASRQEAEPNRPNSWICDGDLRIEGPIGSTWEVNKVSFQIQGDHERVILHLLRTGSGSGDAVSVTAESFPTSTIRDYAVAAARPRSGRKTVGLYFAEGIRDDTNLRQYRPSGMRIVKEISAYRTGGRSSASTKVVTTVAGSGCYKLQIPAWNGPNARRVQKAQVILDVKL